MSGSLGLIGLSVVCGIVGQLSLKVGMTQVGLISTSSLQQPFALVTRVATSPFVVVGLLLYAAGAVTWLAVLSRVPLSLAYPLLGLSYAFTPLLASVLLHENVPSVRWLGVLAICLGVFLVSRG